MMTRLTIIQAEEDTFNIKKMIEVKLLLIEIFVE
jgi:hypothetical protein